MPLTAGNGDKVQTAASHVGPGSLLTENQKVGLILWSQNGHGRPRTDADRLGRADDQTGSDLRECGLRSDVAGWARTSSHGYGSEGWEFESLRARKVKFTRVIGAWCWDPW